MGDWAIGAGFRLGFAAVLSTATVAAQSGQSDKVAADALFDAARDLMEKGRYAEACPKLADSQRLDPGIGTLLNLGRCYAANGQTASAWATYREAAAAARAEGQAEREALARDQAGKLEPKLTRVVIRVSDAAATAGVVVKRDGQELPRSLWGIPTPIDPGEHTLEAGAPGKLPHQATFDARGEGTTLEVEVPELSDAPSAASSQSSQQTPEGAPAPVNPPARLADSSPALPSSGGTRRWLGYAVGGVGVAAGVTGVIFGLKGYGQDQDARALCKDTPDACPSIDKILSLREDAKKNYRYSYIAYGVGGALLVTGAVLVFTAPGGSEAQVVASVGPEGGGAQFRATF